MILRRVSLLWCFWCLTASASAQRKNQNDGQVNSGANDELVLVQTVWRHGWMTPEYDFVHPWLNGLRKPLPKGLVACFQLGKALKQRYVDTQFLNPKNSYSEVHIVSIDYNRSIQAASAKMAAMLPVNDPILDKTTGWPSSWMPIPVHMTSLEMDTKLNMGIVCPTYESLQSNMTNIKEYNKTLQENQGLMTFLSTKLNMTVNRNNIGLVWAALLPGNVPKQDIPHWVNSSLLNRMDMIAKLEEHYKMINPNMTRIRAGPLATDILQRMEAKWSVFQNSSKSANVLLRQLKYYGYSCRGMPMLWQLSTLGAHDFTNDSIPSYASALIYELWNRNGKPYVSVHYYDGKSQEITYVQVRKCPELPEKCPLETFREQVKPYMTDPAKWWYDDCGRPRTNSGSSSVSATAAEPGKYRSLAVVFAILIIVLTLFVIVQICILMRPRKRPAYDSLADRTLLVSSDIR